MTNVDNPAAQKSITSTDLPATILPTDHAELGFLCWFRDLTVPLAPEEAWSIYQAGWRHVAVDRLNPAELALVHALADLYAGGRLPDAVPPWARGRP